MTFLSRCLATLLLALLTACATTPEADLPEKEYYDKAKQALSSGNYLEAVKQLEALDSRYPFGRYAEQAQLDLIYARYKALDPDAAAIAADRFIRLHPQNPHVDYAYYIKGLTSYYADISLAARYFAIDTNARDPGKARDAFNEFSQLVTRFPDSPYAADAERRMIAIKNRLAAYELNVVRYYIKREAYVAATKRAKYIVEHYPETPAVPDALALLVELYKMLHMDQESDDALVLLATSYPDHGAFNDNLQFRGKEVIKQDRSLWSLLSLGIFD